MASADPTHTMTSYPYHDVLPIQWHQQALPIPWRPTHTMASAGPTHAMVSTGSTHTMTSYPYNGISMPYPYHGVIRPYPYHGVSRLLDPTFVQFWLWQACSCLTLHRLWVHWTCAGLTCPFVNPFVSVKNKFGYAHPQEYPYRIQNVLECEFFLLEMMVSRSA